MSQLWKVYRNQQIVGVMDASEIRQSLRDGLIDPFDYVSREGSSVRVQLIEVDEIFEPSSASFSASAGEATSVASNNSSPMPSPTPNSPPHKFRRNRVDPGKALLKKVGFDPAAIPKSSKSFYLIDRNKRVLGPLSPGEIQSLFFRGVLDKSVRVQKMGSERMLNVRQFINVYSGQRIGDLTKNKRAPKTGQFKSQSTRIDLASSKVVNEMSRVLYSRNLAKAQESPAIMLAVGVLFGLLVFVLVQTISNPSKKGQGASSSAHRERVEFIPKSKNESRSTRTLVRKQRPSTEMMELEVPSDDVLVPRQVEQSRKKSKDRLVGADNRRIDQKSVSLNDRKNGPAGSDWEDSMQQVQRQAQDLKKQKQATAVKQKKLPSRQVPSQPQPELQPNQKISTPSVVELRQKSPNQNAVLPRADGRRAKAFVNTSRQKERERLLAARQNAQAKSRKPMKKSQPPPPDPLDKELDEAAGDDLSSSDRSSASADRGPSKVDRKTPELSPKPDMNAQKVKALAARVAPVPPPPPQAEEPVKKAAADPTSFDKMVGEVVTLGPVSFDMGQLESCGLKCRLTIREPQGHTITAIFFKAAHYDGLAAGKGRATITGRLNQEGGKYTLILQDVR